MLVPGLPAILLLFSAAASLLLLIGSMLPEDARGWVVPTGKAFAATAVLAITVHARRTIRSTRKDGH